MKKRCRWATGVPPLYTDYHDTEWGVPQYHEDRLFEMLILEGAQAGLSWYTILRKRDNYRRAFDGFDAAKIAAYDQRKIDQLLTNQGIVRNRLKVAAAVTNARATLQLRARGGGLAGLLWQFVEGVPIINHWPTSEQVPVSTPLSDAMSRELKHHGFKFVGTTICYAFMQAVGMVNDHTTDCFRHADSDLI